MTETTNTIASTSMAMDAEPIQIKGALTSVGSCRAEGRSLSCMAAHSLRVWKVGPGRRAQRHGCGSSEHAQHGEDIEQGEAAPRRRQHQPPASDHGAEHQHAGDGGDPPARASHPRRQEEKERQHKMTEGREPSRRPPPTGRAGLEPEAKATGYAGRR